MKYRHVEIPRERIAEFCRRNGIRRLSLFGSILRDDFGPESDIAVFVEFEPGATPGFGFVGFQEELAETLGRRVDLRAPRDLSRYFRDEVLEHAAQQYARES